MPANTDAARVRDDSRERAWTDALAAYASARAANAARRPLEPRTRRAAPTSDVPPPGGGEAP